MFCKICSDSGKIGFDTHNVRDRTGKVVCPVLLSTVCRKCGQTGHTVKYCTSTYDNHVKKLARVSFTPEVKPPAKKTIKQNQNIFSYFDQCDECDDESDDDCMIYDINNIICRLILVLMYVCVLIILIYLLNHFFFEKQYGTQLLIQPVETSTIVLIFNFPFVASDIKSIKFPTVPSSKS